MLLKQTTSFIQIKLSNYACSQTGRFAGLYTNLQRLNTQMCAVLIFGHMQYRILYPKIDLQ